MEAVKLKFTVNVPTLEKLDVLVIQLVGNIHKSFNQDRNQLLIY